MKRTILTTAAIFAVMMIGLSAQADPIEFDDGAEGNSNWSSAENWDGDEVPADGDAVTIPNGKTCYVDINNARADSFTIESTGTLIINSNCLLEIDSNSSVANTSGVSLADSGAKLKISDSLTISGAGSILGEDDAAAIEIAGTSKTLTSQVTIAGALQIVGAQGSSYTTFLNYGSVVADGGTIEVYTTYLDNQNDTRDAVESGDWIVGSGGNDELWMRVGSDELSGDFTVGGGTLDVDASITTSGELSASVGSTIEVYQGTSFQALSTN